MIDINELLIDLRKLRIAYANKNLWASVNVVDLILNKITTPTAEDEETDNE